MAMLVMFKLVALYNSRSLTPSPIFLTAHSTSSLNFSHAEKHLPIQFLTTPVRIFPQSSTFVRPQKFQLSQPQSSPRVPLLFITHFTDWKTDILLRDMARSRAARLSRCRCPMCNRQRARRRSLRRKQSRAHKANKLRRRQRMIRRQGK